MSDKELLKQKVQQEYADIKHNILKLTSSAVYDKAYYIVCIERITQSLISHIDDISDERARCLIKCKNLVAWFTEDWLNFDDMEDLGSELDDFVKSNLMNPTYGTAYFS